MKRIIKEVNSLEILDFTLKFFPGYKVSKNPFEKLYAYYIDDIIVGFIVYSIIYERAEIDYIAVDEKYRGSDIAQTLFDYFIDAASECESISLEVRCDNIRAIKFYLKNGFEIVSTKKKYYGDTDGFLMIKNMR